MKKISTLATVILACCAYTGYAQSQDESSTTKKIRIVKEINENGKITQLDTTIEVSGNDAEIREALKGIDEQSLPEGAHKEVRVRKFVDENGQERVEKEVTVRVGTAEDGTEDIHSENMDDMKHMMVIETDGNGDEPAMIKCIINGKEVTPEDGHAVWISDGKGEPGQRMEVTVNDDVFVNEDGKEVHKRIVMITRLSGDEAKELQEKGALDKQQGTSELASTELKFFPNPSDGKFHLAFELPNTGATDVRIVDIQERKCFMTTSPTSRAGTTKTSTFLPMDKGFISFR